MKCLACGHENIYGSTACKECGASLKEKPAAAAAPAPTPAPAAPAPAPTATPVAAQAAAPASEQELYPNELTFIPYIGNEQFNHFLRVLRRAFDFNTRSSRAEFWWFTLFQFLIGLAILMIMPFLSPIYSLLLMIPAIAVSIRRLHDIGKSGWWLLLIFLPLIGAIVLLVFFVLESQQDENEWGAVTAV